MGPVETAAGRGARIPDLQAEQIGGRIRSMRQARGLTLVQLAEIAELSHPFLSQLERGLARPSIASLERIARALDTSQVELLTAPDEGASETSTSPIGIVRGDEGTRGRYAEGEARMLVSGRRRFHPMELTASNVVSGDYFTHQEDEFVHVIEGRVEVDLGEGGLFELASGDSIYYAGGTAHRWRSLDGRPFRLFVVKEHPARL